MGSFEAKTAFEFGKGLGILKQKSILYEACGPFQVKASLEEKSTALDGLQRNLGQSRSESQQLVQQKEQQLTQLRLDLEKVSIRTHT